ncbi:hypothetical protein [Tabrizicola sp.]|uniref:hypothetical protein n=1 Tax=Tabrizicola sp. TaxID=2005166 RepID=UPI003F398D45
MKHLFAVLMALVPVEAIADESFVCVPEKRCDESDECVPMDGEPAILTIVAATGQADLKIEGEGLALRLEPLPESNEAALRFSGVIQEGEDSARILFALMSDGSFTASIYEPKDRELPSGSISGTCQQAKN